MVPMQLRDYQEEAVTKALATKRGTIKAATGSGKSVMAIEWLKRLGKPAIIIVPTQALIYQAWIPKLSERFGDVGEYWAERKSFGDITVTTFSSAASHPEMLAQYPVAVIDEIHHLGAQQALHRILPALLDKEYVLGLSAIPERPDEAHNEFLSHFPICFSLSLGEAMEKGFVAPLEIVDMPVSMTQEESLSYDNYTGKIEAAMKYCGHDMRRWSTCKGIDALGKTRYWGFEGLKAMSARKKLLATLNAKLDQVCQICVENEGKMVLIFSESIPAVEMMKERLEKIGLRARCAHSRIPARENMSTLEEWGSSFEILLSCRSLEEGIDVKEVSIGIIVASGRSKRQLVQRIGRIVRQKEGKTAKVFVVWGKSTMERQYVPEIARLIKR